MGNQRWLLIGTDYFMKWVEAESLSNIRDINAKKFVSKNIVTRFGIPTLSSQKMGSSLTVKLLGDTVVNWALGTNIQLQLIHKEMGRLKQSTKL